MQAKKDSFFKLTFNFKGRNCLVYMQFPSLSQLGKLRIKSLTGAIKRQEWISDSREETLIILFEFTVITSKTVLKIFCLYPLLIFNTQFKIHGYDWLGKVQFPLDFACMGKLFVKDQVLNSG